MHKSSVHGGVGLRGQSEGGQGQFFRKMKPQGERHLLEVMRKVNAKAVKPAVSWSNQHQPFHAEGKRWGIQAQFL